MKASPPHRTPSHGPQAASGAAATDRAAGSTPVPVLPTLERYRAHRRETTAWMVRSVAAGGGGSCAHFAPLTGWSRPYPETTGYLIPTLLE
ncbi:MAG TPA: hypothetical protein VM890_03825, partial [Longimicrobium sp.]|nr:hypothetical protein [Longimicrobium sp.]